MAHAKTQVRDGFVSILSVAPVEWQLVINSRLFPARDLPKFVLVWVEAESINREAIHGPAMQERDITVVTQGMIRITDPETMEDDLDRLAAELETKMTASALRTALSKNNVWLELESSVSDLDIDEEEERVFAGVTHTWRVRLFTEEGAPETIVS